MKPFVMDRAHFALLLGFATAAILPGCAKPDLKAAAIKAIQADYNAEDAAVARKNVDGAFQYHTPDCQFIGRNGVTTTMTQNRGYLILGFSQTNMSSTRTTQVENVKFNNAQSTEAIVTVKRHTVIAMAGSGSAQPTTLNFDTEDRDYWVQKPEGWRISREKLVQAAGRRNRKSPGNSAGAPGDGQ